MKLHRFTWLILLCFLVSPTKLTAGSERKVLLINSDGKVTKYALAQEEFIKTFPNPVLKVNLGEKKWRIYITKF